MAEILKALIHHADAAGGATALTDDDTTLTWSELAARVSAFAGELADAPPVLGLLGDNEADWVIALLAGWLAGKTLVPLPTFFSPAQLHHVMRDAGIGEVIFTHRCKEVSAALAMPVRPVTWQGIKRVPTLPGAAGMVIYTSGSTGAPKGVRLGLDQIDWQTNTLAAAAQARPQDRHLSVLPLSLLLEVICAVGVPVLVGGHTHLATDASRMVGRGSVPDLAELFRRQMPTTTVLVPQLLSAWVAQLEAADLKAPEGLRFVAAGGAPLSSALAERAWHRGIPVYEGYGLSECCSVVAVNRPGSRKAGTVGTPLPGLEVRIEAGEIIVDGPTVMQGYLNGPDAAGTWHTGDVGHLDAQGFLTVTGRKDNLLVTAFGRNVSPEWIEAMLLADPRLAACAIFGHGESDLKVLLIPSPVGEAWVENLPPALTRLWIEQMCAEAPSYAVPGDFAVCPLAEALQRGLLVNGRIVRTAAESAFDEFRPATRPDTPDHNVLTPTKPEDPNATTRKNTNAVL